jgi:membrane-bound lytic murein transglycosylase B
MKLRYLLIVVSIFLLFTGCASHEAQIKTRDSEIKTRAFYCDDSVSAESEIPNEIQDVQGKIEELKQNLIINGVPGEWFDKQMKHNTFRIHSNIDQCFHKSAEKQTDHDKIHDVSWYFTRIGVDAKIKKGESFVEKHLDIFNRAEARHGIHKELIAAIIGIETNFADTHQRGNFYAFNSLVSQYVFTNRTKFAVREITALYKFSQKTGHPPQYFTSSYAGAIGWGQFIPSSLLAFFIDSNGINDDVDPFSIEDTIFSVENYLYNNKLSGKNIDDDESKYKAVFAYNHSDVYVKAVLYIHDGLRNYFHPEETAKK